MNILFWALLLSFSFTALNVFAQQGPADDRMWSRINVDQTPREPLDPNYKWDPAPYEQKFYNFGGGITVEPNFRPFPGSNTTQSELSIDVHPSDQDIIYCSANATN
ncbi:MAG: hypothetical protein R3321_11810, partial [Nitrososphaeraceae archaeon]|nr:hypothetical protein [Nitrososphaeraceae archaeon]